MTDKETPQGIMEREHVSDSWLLPQNNVFQTSLDGNLGHPLGMESHAVEYRSEHSYDTYCRSLGARDLFDLASIESDGKILAERIRSKMPSHLSLALNKFFADISEEITDFQIPSNAQHWSQDQTLWDHAMNFLRGYIITNIECTPVRVPVFCAHPPKHDNGKCRVIYSRTNSSSLSFTIGVPGLGGGHGLVQDRGYNITAEEITRPYQRQATISCNIIERTSSRGDTKITMVPLDIVGDSDADEGEHYIDYDKSVKTQMIGVPFKKRSQSVSWEGPSITNGSYDKFAIGGQFNKIGNFNFEVESTTKEEFKVEFCAVPGHEYELRGLGKRCHDIFIDCTKLGGPF